MKKVRCAIYTRKSSEEGLEQDFNSLDAQREACAAYVMSQASEGWSLLAEKYDDGGLSGGTLERPALQRLLASVEAGKIDIVVVYKVDRLTRSLLDFTRLVEAFDRAGTSFVSVTQSFNTTTSMGRLTLNMLLSFAQFEREVTAERIRDKIAASKAKGMWMGGIPPLGYEPDGRTLKIVEKHARMIREVFQRYLDLGNVRLLKEQLDEEAIAVPERTASTGRKMGGSPFTRGQIYKLLSNPIYVGEVHHNGKVFAGQHQPIIDREIWDAVQLRLADNRQGKQQAASIHSPSLLAGKVLDAEGQRLVASHACKGTVRYRYYVSKALQHEPGSTDSGWRIPALELEKVVCGTLVNEVRNPLALIDKLRLELSPHQITRLTSEARHLAERMGKRDRLLVRRFVKQVHVAAALITVELDIGNLAAALGLDVLGEVRAAHSITIPVGLRRSGRAMRLLQEDGRAVGSPEPQQHLVKLLNRARSWWEEMSRDGLTPAALGRKHGVTSSYASRLIRLNFLAPEIISAIVTGGQPAALDGKTLLNLSSLPLGWADQKKLLHID